MPDNSAIGGANEEFVFSGRLDNLCSVYTAMQALLKSTEDVQAVEAEERGWMAAFFDNEEIGSATAQVESSSQQRRKALPFFLSART
jgi:aspartyl aminopeptidase